MFDDQLLFGNTEFSGVFWMIVKLDRYQCRFTEFKFEQSGICSQEYYLIKLTLSGLKSFTEEVVTDSKQDLTSSASVQMLF